MLSPVLMLFAQIGSTLATTWTLCDLVMSRPMPSSHGVSNNFFFEIQERQPWPSLLNMMNLDFPYLSDLELHNQLMSSKHDCLCKDSRIGCRYSIPSPVDAVRMAQPRTSEAHRQQFLPAGPCQLAQQSILLLLTTSCSAQADRSCLVA